MSLFRADVAKLVAAAVPALTPIPVRDSASGRPTLRRGATGDVVAFVQRALGLEVTGIFDPITEARVRAFQREQQLVPDGIVGPKSGGVLDRRPTLATG
jgi:peptidoglycan hydrolase-like protein with peptidoglycan-binding domain